LPYPVKEAGLLYLIAPSSKIAPNPDEVGLRRLTGDIRITFCNLAKDHLYEIASEPKLFVIDVANTRELVFCSGVSLPGEVKQVKVGIQSSWANEYLDTATDNPHSDRKFGSCRPLYVWI
jgi:hypothetical protein